MGYRIVMGADSAGVEYRDALRAELRADPRVDAVMDVGVETNTDDKSYPHIAVKAARMVADGIADRALLICGTGLGMAIAANKVAGVRAVTAHDIYSVERSIKSNDARVLCMGQRVVGLELARTLAKAWLGFAFDPTSGSGPKVQLINDYDGSAEPAPYA